MLKSFNYFKKKKIIDKDCIYCQVGGNCNECKLKLVCNSYLSNKNN